MDCEPGEVWRGEWVISDLRKNMRTNQGVTEEYVSQESVAEKVAGSRRQGTGKPGGARGTCPLKWPGGLARLAGVNCVESPRGWPAPLPDSQTPQRAQCGSWKGTEAINPVHLLT